MSSVTPINVTQSGEFMFDRALSRRDEAVYQDELRDEMIADKQAALIASRMSALSDDDLVCALQSASGATLCKNVRDAIQKRDPYAAFGVLSALVSCWITEDSETEAIKYIERLERDSEH
jgi:hypothetical protein